jgi:acyl-CoA synthetase (NDP forming)/RimJ/RimL family protein N-acetyltransferase
MVQPPEPEPATPPVPPGYPARWEFDAVLTDGGTVHIRPVVPADAEAIDAFHVRQSRETIYFRYFSPLPRLSARDLDRIVNIDYLTHMGLVALLGDEVVGLASYDMWPDHNEAEVAFIVDDAHQGRGLATVLLEYLAVAARENGLDGLTATVLPTNRKMLGVFHDAGFQVASAFEEGVIEVRLGIEPTEEGRLVIEDRERRSEAASVTRLLSPASIAVIGAGRERGGIGHEVFRNLVAGGFDGPVYPVNPAGGHVASVRAYQSVLDIPDAVDLAVVAVPAGGVLDVVEECGRKRVRGLVIFSAGFDRLPEGTEERIVERAHATGMRVIGPESMGVINTAPGVSLIASFGEVAVRPGNVGFLTQSGTLGLAALDHAHRLGVGFSTFVDVGSKIDVSGNDLLQFWATDERTTVVALHLQSFGNPRKFTRIVRDLARAKPVVAVKSGRARPGAGEAKRMGESWSAGDLTDAATDAMLAQSGVIRVETPTQLFDAARVLSSQPVPAGRRVAIVSNARGASVLAVDACIGAGLETPEPSAATVAALAGRLPEGARLSNPFELTWEAGPDAFRAAVSAALADDAFDSVVVLYAPPVQPRPAEVAAAVGDAMAGADKPVIATFLGSEPGDEVDGVRPGVPLFRVPSEGARTLGRLAAYGDWLSRPAGTLPSAEELGLHVAAVQARVAGLLVADPEGRRLEHAEAADLLALAGLPACPTVMVVGPDEAVAAARAMGYPVVLKASGVGRYHRGEVGGVALDLHDDDALRAAFGRMVTTLHSAMDPAIVQKAVPSGADVLVAGQQHPAFGGVVTVGLGGAAAAANNDLPVRVLPLSDTDAAELVAASQVGGLLAGEEAGGAHSAAIGGLTHLLVRFAALLEQVPELAGVVVNPVIVGPGGAAITDAWVHVAPYRLPTAPEVRRLDWAPGLFLGL